VTLAAFDVLWSQGQDVNLVLVGKQGWLVDDLVAALQNHPERGARLFWLTGVSDEYLAKVYEASTCLVTASVGEGFGLPLIEAAQHKMPIIARDLPVFREVAGDCATYFSGDHLALAATVDSWGVSYRNGHTPDISKMPWLTWEQSAEQLKSELLGPRGG
jgi:glycosyltransferase involved in cell wall biosynthesis